MRQKIPQAVVERLMFENRHTCCICRSAGKHIQIHHIDENPSNNASANLAVLCLDCHSRVTGDEGLGRRFTAGEIRLYKGNWEQQSGTAANENKVECVESHYEETVLEAGTHLSYEYLMKRGDQLSLFMESDELLDVMVMTADEYDDWLDEKVCEALERHDDVYSLKFDLPVPMKDDYVVVLCNETDEETDVTIDLSIWRMKKSK